MLCIQNMDGTLQMREIVAAVCGYALIGSVGCTGPVACNQRFLDIQKQMSDRILAAQAESERIIAQYTPELTSEEKTAQRTAHNERAQSKPRSIAQPANDGASGSSAPSPGDVMSLTSNSPSLMLLKNLVKEKERRASLGPETGSHSEEPARTDAMDASVQGRGEGEESEAWVGEGLCSKGWLPIILEEDERIAQSVEAGHSSTPPGSGSVAKLDYSGSWALVTPILIPSFLRF